MTKERKVHSKNGTAQNITMDEQIKKIEIGRTCGTYGGEDKCIQGKGGESEGKRSLGRLRCRLAYNNNNINKTNLQEIGVRRVDWFDMAQDRNKWQAVAIIIIIIIIISHSNNRLSGLLWSPY